MYKIIFLAIYNYFKIDKKKTHYQTIMNDNKFIKPVLPFLLRFLIISFFVLAIFPLYQKKHMRVQRLNGWENTRRRKK